VIQSHPLHTFLMNGLHLEITESLQCISSLVWNLHRAWEAKISFTFCLCEMTLPQSKTLVLIKTKNKKERNKARFSFPSCSVNIVFCNDLFLLCILYFQLNNVILILFLTRLILY
jgi:hypothetical protein